MHYWSVVSLAACLAVCSAGVIPRFDYSDNGLNYEGKVVDPNRLPLKDLGLSYPSYPLFYPYANPYFLPNYGYHPYQYYNQRQVLDKDGRQGKLSPKKPVSSYQAPFYGFQWQDYYKTPENYKVPEFKLPQYVYQPFPTKQEKVQDHNIPAPPAAVPSPPVEELPEVQEFKPPRHQHYKEVEILPEIHEAPSIEQEQQIVHKDEPALKSFIYIGKYSGSCKGEKDGLYYVDKKTFAYCVDQRDVFQPCPEGTENPDAKDFSEGKLQYSHHFCSVNLLAQNPEPAPTHPDPHYNAYQYEEVQEEKY